MKDIKKKKQRSISWLFLLLICLSTGFMGIGYAQINTALKITGTSTGVAQENIFITEVNYIGDVNADLINSKILSTYQTMLNSNVVLSSTNPNSTITYEVIVYNSTETDYQFSNTSYMLGNSTYSNENIAFSLEGLAKGDILKSKETISFRVTFYYKNNTLPASNELKSFINFEFQPFVPLVSAGTLNTDSSMGIFGGTIDKGNVERIYFVNHENVPSGASAVWDASVEGNYAITAWAIDEDQNGLVEICFGANNGRISLPADCSSMFYYYVNLKELDFDNIDTSRVTNMNNMFYYNNSLTEINVSNFDTSNVTNMGYMFGYCSGIKKLDLSSFDTSKVTGMSYMLYGTNSEIIKMNNASFSHISNAYGVFPYTSNPLIIVVKDSVEKNWVLSKGNFGANTQILTVAEYETMYPNG